MSTPSSSKPLPILKDVLFHTLSSEQCLKILETTNSGLTKTEASTRLTTYGPNALTPAKTRTIWIMIWEQLYNIITGILIAAAIIAGVFHEYIEVGFILAVVVANVAIGVVQEGRAEAATAAIKAMVSASALVLRNGRKIAVDASILVPGDIVYLTSGDRLPADVRWLETSNLQVTEAMLTGESAPISKNLEPVEGAAPLGDRACMGFTGTLVFTGQGVGLVVATGDSAEIGKINGLMSSVAAAKTPLLEQIEGFGFVLSILCLLIALISFLVAYFGRHMHLQEAFEAAVSVAVALIPEGLPTVVTITLAMGVQAMARQKSVIRQLPAVETLGAVTCICSDKTGTLTKNEMTAVGVHAPSGVFRVTGTGYSPEGFVVGGPREEHLSSSERDTLCQLLLPAVLCNDATLMPLVSAHAQTMMTTQTITLPQLVEPSQSHMSQPPIARTPPPSSPKLGGISIHNLNSMASPSFVIPDVATAARNMVPITLEATNDIVGDSIVRSMTTSLRMIKWDTTGDPTEAALLALAMKAGLNLKTLNELANACPRIGTLPFSSENKFMATAHDITIPSTSGGGTRRVLFVKGAPDVLLPRCSAQASTSDPWKTEPLDMNRWIAANKTLASEGLRVIALCTKTLPSSDAENISISSSEILSSTPSLTLNVLVAIVDPPREEAIKAIHDCHVAGITVKMITGDHAETAATIGSWIGIETPGGVLTGPALEAMDDVELEKRVEAVHIFARASPEHKLRIVRALQKHGHVVAMTGDGVNDSPALRQANVGVAMGIAGTEVAKEASKMILLDDNFATLAAAVAQGRTTYDNLRKLIAFLLPTSVAQGVSIAVAVFANLPPPLTPVQILYVNMITAATLGLVLATEPAESDTMKRPPRRQGKPLVGKAIAWRTFFVGFCMIAAMLGQQSWTLSIGGSVRLGHTMAMNTLVISQCLYCLSCRFLSDSSLSFSAVAGNPWLTGMVVLNVALQSLITYVPALQDIWETAPMDASDWGRVLLFALIIFLLVEAEKKWGPALVRPYVMPIVKRLVEVLSFSKGSKGPSPFIISTNLAVRNIVAEAHTIGSIRNLEDLSPNSREMQIRTPVTPLKTEDISISLAN
jgi:magnesium-transporting ATPase (P-type)